MSKKDISKLPSGWPDKNPGLQFDRHGWFQHGGAFKSYLNDSVKNVCEVGTWLGSSARKILEMSPHCNLYAIDHWSSDINDYGAVAVGAHGWNDKLPNLFEQFVSNCWGYKDRLHILRGDSHAMLKLLGEYDVKMDLVYIDGGHDYDVVYNDIALSVANWPDATIVGDDYSWESVSSAAQDFAKSKNMTIKVLPNHLWQLIKE